ncbi:MAG: dTDP-4-dehydrorhamnose reductase, partial [Prochlorothrix sp.]
MSIALSPPFQTSPFPLPVPTPADRPLRVLILGCCGQVGRSLQAVIDHNTTVIPWDRSQFDLTHLSADPEQPDTQRLYHAVQALHPDVIINGAAYTAVDRAEEEPDLAERINGTALGPLAHLAQTCGAALIHISTDYVFNGFGHKPYREEDAPDPLGVYGRSKLAGEKALVAAGLDRWVILRTAWVYSEFDRPNFLKTMLRLGQDREEVRIVADQVGSPTWARDIAAVIAALIPRLYQDSSLSGI